MLFHLPLAFLPLGAAPGDVAITLPAIEMAVGANVPTAAAGMSVTLPAVGIAISGGAPDLFEGEMITLPAADIALAAAVPTDAAGMSTTIGHTISLASRFGVLGERPLGAPPVAASSIMIPLILEIGGSPIVTLNGAMLTLEHTRTSPSRFGCLGERPLGAAPIMSSSVTGPAVIEIIGRAPEGFGRRRRPSTHAVVS